MMLIVECRINVFRPSLMLSNGGVLELTCIEIVCLLQTKYLVVCELDTTKNQQFNGIPWLLQSHLHQNDLDQSPWVQQNFANCPNYNFQQIFQVLSLV